MLSVEGLTFGYSNQQSQVSDVSFTVPPGEILGLLGPNGAGKTTLVSLIAGLLSPQKGRVLIDGKPARLGRPDVALVPQEHAFYSRLTGGENLRYFAGSLGLDSRQARQRTDRALASCELAELRDQRAGTYSGGMKRRLNFAIALIQEPRLLILDEPTVGVDPQSRAFLLDIIRHLNRNGVTLIYTSHLLAEVESLCHSVVLMDAGRIVLQGEMASVLSEQHSCVHIRLSRDLPGQLGAEMSARYRGDKWWEINLLESGLSLAQLLGRLEAADCVPDQVRYGQRQLEEVFLSATRERERELQT